MKLIQIGSELQVRIYH